MTVAIVDTSSVALTFQRNMHVISEGEVVTVCVTRNGDIDRDIEYSLAIDNDGELINAFFRV